MDSFLSKYRSIEANKAPSSEGGKRFRLAVLAQCIASEKGGVDMLSLFDACLCGHVPSTSAERAVYDLACELDRAAAQAISSGQIVGNDTKIGSLLDQIICKDSK